MQECKGFLNIKGLCEGGADWWWTMSPPNFNQKIKEGCLPPFYVFPLNELSNSGKSLCTPLFDVFSMKKKF